MKRFEIITKDEHVPGKVWHWGEGFNTFEDAYDFAVNHIKAMKLMCGDIYIPYEIIDNEAPKESDAEEIKIQPIQENVIEILDNLLKYWED